MFITLNQGKSLLKHINMAVNCGNVDVIIDHNIKQIPECEHGNAPNHDKQYRKD